MRGAQMTDMTLEFEEEGGSAILRDADGNEIARGQVTALKCLTPPESHDGVEVQAVPFTATPRPSSAAAQERRARRRVRIEMKPSVESPVSAERLAELVLLQQAKCKHRWTFDSSSESRERFICRRCKAIREQP
jgi:hypothetical protein